MRKIVADLKVPFALKGDIRQDDTPVHQALREAKETPELSIPEMATRLGKSQRTVERATRELRAAGKLTRIGPDKGGYWKVTDGK